MPISRDLSITNIRDSYFWTINVAPGNLRQQETIFGDYEYNIRGVGAGTTVPTRNYMIWLSRRIGIQRREVGTSEWQLAGSVGNGVTTFEDRSVSQGKGFVYRVRAVNEHGATLASNECRSP